MIMTKLNMSMIKLMNYKNEIKILKDIIIDFENKLDYKENQNKLLKNMLKHFSIFRGAFYKNFHFLI